MENWYAPQVGRCLDGGFTGALGLPMSFQQNLRKTCARSNPNSLANGCWLMPHSKRSVKFTRDSEGEQTRSESLANSHSERQVVELDFQKMCIYRWPQYGRSVVSIFDAGSSNGAAGTKLKGLGPLRLEYFFVASLMHVSVRISSRFHTFPVSGWGTLRWLAAIHLIFRFTKHSGLHDNACTATLSYLQTEGLLDKLIA